MKRGIAILLTAFMLVFAGCADETPSVSGVPSDTDGPSATGQAEPSIRPPGAPALITINGKDIPDDEIHYILSKTLEQYITYNGEIDWDSETDGLPIADFLRQCAREEIIASHVIYHQADTLGFELDSEELSYIDTAIEDEIEMSGGRNAFDITLESMGCSEDVYRFYHHVIPTIQGKLSMGLFLPGAPYAPADEDIESLFASDFTNVSYILITKIDESGNLFTGDALQSQHNIARTLHEKAVNGEDFTELVREYTQDIIMEMSPEGFPVPKGYNDEEFDRAVAALQEGEISPVVEAYDRFYIIKRLPPDPDWFSENRWQVEMHYESVTYDKLVKEWCAAADVSILPEFEQLDIRDYLPKG